MGTQLRKVLAFGVGGLPGWTPQQAQKLVSNEIERAARAGFDLEVHALQINNTEKQILDEAEQILLKRDLVGVAFGFGIRGNKDHTPIFEKLVNLALEKVHPVPRLAFPVLPDQIVESFERVFP